jgi:hypothetical protein
MMTDQQPMIDQTDTVEDALSDETEAVELAPGGADDQAPAELEPNGRPVDVPDKFWDPEQGCLRTDALLKSYLQLEKKLGAMVPLPSLDDSAGRQRLQQLLGQPDTADDYQIEASGPLVEVDPEINARLHAAGFSSEQAQLVYDLAAERLAPMVEEVIAEAGNAQATARLQTHFGGDQSWRTIAPQIRKWGEANLAPEIFETLASNPDGVIAMHQMMRADEPRDISEAAVPTGGVDENALTSMMRDPRYWRDRDPAFIAQVTEGYKRLYGD